MRRFLLLPVLLFSGLALSFCGEKALPVIAVTAQDYSFTAPQSIAGGPLRIRFENKGKESHHMQLFKLKEGTTLEKLQMAVAGADFAALFQLVSAEGGPAPIDPGRTETVVLDLKPGNYVLVCFIQSPDKIPHVAKGMFSMVTVTAPAGDVPKMPKAKATVKLKDFTFELPAEIKSGPFSINVINDGPQPHEMAIVKLASGKKLADVIAWFQNPSGPPPAEAVGGMNALDAGRSGIAELDLTPGNYAAICLVPDPGSKLPHIALGMGKEFTVK